MRPNAVFERFRAAEGEFELKSAEIARKSDLNARIERGKGYLEEAKLELERNLPLKLLSEQGEKQEEVADLAESESEIGLQALKNEVNASFDYRKAQFLTKCVAILEENREICMEEIGKRSLDGLKTEFRERNTRIKADFEEISEKITVLKAELQRKRDSSSPISDLLSSIHPETLSKSLSSLKSKAETLKKVSNSSNFANFEVRISALQSKLASISKVSALKARISVLESRTPPTAQITDDTSVEISAGEVQAESDTMMISIHELGDSDLESQGYISPHLSPLNALLGHFRFGEKTSTGTFPALEVASPKATLVKVDDFVSELANSLIFTETDSAFRLYFQFLSESSVRPPAISLMGRSTLQYSEANGDTLEDDIDLSDLEEGEQSPSFAQFLQGK